MNNNENSNNSNRGGGFYTLIVILTNTLSNKEVGVQVKVGNLRTCMIDRKGVKSPVESPVINPYSSIIQHPCGDPDSSWIQSLHRKNEEREVCSMCVCIYIIYAQNVLTRERAPLHQWSHTFHEQTDQICSHKKWPKADDANVNLWWNHRVFKIKERRERTLFWYQ